MRSGSCSGSQEERIGILKLALTEKGVSVGTHYDLESPSRQNADAQSHSNTGATVNAEIAQTDIDDDTGGIYL